MILSGKKIEEYLDSNIIIKPFDKKRVNPNSYNLRLHDELLVYDSYELDMKKKKHCQQSRYTKRRLSAPAKQALFRTHDGIYRDIQSLFLCWKDALP